MFNVDIAKEIVLKKNKDNTWNMIAKFDLYNNDGVSINSEAEFTYPRIIINKFDTEALVADDKLYEVIINNKE